jgi:hypothetical protein
LPAGRDVAVGPLEVAVGVGVLVLGAKGGEASTGVIFTIHRLADNTTINNTLKKILLR